jgi:hypothetical protein
LPTTKDTATFVECDSAEDTPMRVDTNDCLHNALLLNGPGNSRHIWVEAGMPTLL